MVQVEFHFHVDDFYVEGSSQYFDCISMNFLPLLRGITIWIDSLNVTVGEMTLSFDPLLRHHAGVYTCVENLFDQSRRVTVPSRSFTLVVHCKFCHVLFTQCDVVCWFKILWNNPLIGHWCFVKYVYGYSHSGFIRFTPSANVSIWYCVVMQIVCATCKSAIVLKIIVQLL